MRVRNLVIGLKTLNPSPLMIALNCAKLKQQPAVDKCSFCLILFPPFPYHLPICLVTNKCFRSPPFPLASDQSEFIKWNKIRVMLIIRRKSLSRSKRLPSLVTDSTFSSMNDLFILSHYLFVELSVSLLNIITSMLRRDIVQNYCIYAFTHLCESI